MPLELQVQDDMGAIMFLVAITLVLAVIGFDLLQLRRR